MDLIKLIRTGPDNEDFRELVQRLDEILRESDGADHPFYDQFNKLDKIKNVVVAYAGNVPAGCGSIKQFSAQAAEVKRMFVPVEFRGKGIGKKILRELEAWAKELNFSECILETGKRQKEAVGLYQSSGYEVIPNYGQYKEVEQSVCMRKNLE